MAPPPPASLQKLDPWDTDPPKRSFLRRHRICCCSLYACIWITLLLILIVVGVLVGLFFGLFKQPTVQVLGINPPQSGALPIFQPDGDTLGINMTLNIKVTNPNNVGATLSSIIGRGYSDVLGDTVIANAETRDAEIPANGVTTLVVPFTAMYGNKLDPEQKGLKDLLTKCGLLGGKRVKVPLKYEVDVYVRVLVVSVGLPTFKGSTSFDCPIPQGFTNPQLDQLINKLK